MKTVERLGLTLASAILAGSCHWEALATDNIRTLTRMDTYRGLPGEDQWKKGVKATTTLTSVGISRNLRRHLPFFLGLGVESFSLNKALATDTLVVDGSHQGHGIQFIGGLVLQQFQVWLELGGGRITLDSSGEDRIFDRLIHLSAITILGWHIYQMDDALMSLNCAYGLKSIDRYAKVLSQPQQFRFILFGMSIALFSP